MTITELTDRRDTMRAKMHAGMDMRVIKAAQARIDLLSYAIQKLEALTKAEAEAKQAIADAEDWA